MTDTALELEHIAKHEKDGTVSLRFTVANRGDTKTYEFVKLYVGDTYIDLDYLDLDAGQSKTTAFEVDANAVSNNPDIILTTKGRQEGALFNDRYEKFDEEGERHIASDGKKKLMRRLREEYDDLQEHGGVEGETRESGFLGSVVDSVFGTARNPGGTNEPAEQETPSEKHHSTERMQQEQRTPALPDMERVETGVIGLDSKMRGGFVQGTMNLVTGKTGTGKTAFCASFLKQGANNGEPGVYVTTEEREEDIKDDIESMFGWDFQELEEQNLAKILSIKPIFPSKEIENINRLVRSYISNLLDQVMQAVDEIDAERVIIDSVSIIEMFIRDEYMARVALASLLNKLRGANVTALLTGTVPETSEGLSGGGIIEFLVDTVILLEFVPVAEEHSRTMTIRKMRRTDHDTSIFPFEITPQGLELFELP